MWHAFARQLSNPDGWVGLAVGKLMKFANREPTKIAVEALSIEPGNDVLDLGCGPGQAVAQMLPLARPGQVHGVDQSPTMIGAARRANGRAVLQGQSIFKQADFSQLPFGDNSFDRILASNVMYFWHETTPVLNEVRRVLRPGGRIAIYLTSAETMRHWGIASAGTHRLFSVDDVREALLTAGFDPTLFDVREVSLAGRVSGILAVATLH